ncbi:MAG: prephenate dehydrogenase/arogenate dehydrogenase family protein [Verrucomicrobiota bacterium]|nr:prephenate dehydrogenase/arogenate dehydrogenase family protein [Verrucomicrobiota bacterium]
MIFVFVRPMFLARPNWVWCVTANPARRQCSAVLSGQSSTLLDSQRLRRFNTDVALEKLTIIGAGLLGGSVGLAARACGQAKRVAALVRRSESVAECQALGIADEVTLDPLAAVANADLVVLCTPISGMAGLAKRILPHLKLGTVLTDVGSSKRQLVAELTPLCTERGVHFVGSHPMAGSEQTGPTAARANLFDGAVCVLTPAEGTNAGALASVNAFWTCLGSHPVEMSPGLHDQLVARCSHLPHLLSSALASSVLDSAHGKQQTQLCSTGFRDMTRLAAGSPVMWRDIVGSNRDDILAAIDEFADELGELRMLIAGDSPKAIESWLQKAKAAWDDWDHSVGND